MSVCVCSEYFLVVLGPQAIGPSCPRKSEHPIVPGMFTSDGKNLYRVSTITMIVIIMVCRGRVNDSNDNYGGGGGNDDDDAVDSL